MNLTGAGKIALIFLIVGALGAGYYFFGPNPHPALNEPATTATAPEGGPSGSGSEAENVASDDNTASSESSTASSSDSPFSYTAPEPVDGKLKGVVELGASGFNWSTSTKTKTGNSKKQNSATAWSLKIWPPIMTSGWVSKNTSAT